MLRRGYSGSSNPLQSLDPFLVIWNDAGACLQKFNEIETEKKKNMRQGTHTEGKGSGILPASQSAPNVFLFFADL